MQLNPTKAEIAEAAKAWEAKGAKEVSAALRDKIGEIEAVHEQLSQDYNWDKVTKLGGEKNDKRDAFRKMNAECAALRDRMREIQQIDSTIDARDRASEISERNGGSRPPTAAERAEVERLAALPPSELQAHQTKRFLREAAAQANIEVAGEGRGKDSIVYAIANRTHGVERLSIPLDYMIGPRLGDPVNVLTGGTAGDRGGGSAIGTAGFSIYPPMTDTLIRTPFPPTMVMDLVRRLSTRSNLYVYRAQTSDVPQLEDPDADDAAHAKAAGWTVENNEGQEISPKWETQTSPVVKCLAYAEITEEQIEDGEDVDGLVADQLRLELRNSVERDLLQGTGNNGRMNGIFGVSGYTNFAYANPGANLTSYGMDEISKGMFTIMKDVWMMPDRVVMHPLDWHALSTTRDEDGRLQFMDPTEAAAQRVFGLPVVFSAHMNLASGNQGNVGLGAFGSAAAIVDRREVQIARTDAHDENFTKDVMTIKASVRVAAARFYDNAFYRITGFQGKRAGA